MANQHLKVWIIDTNSQRIGIIAVWHQIGKVRLFHTETIIYLLRILAPVRIKKLGLKKKLSSLRHRVHIQSHIVILFLLPL